jgi:hypothetical protein
MVRRPADANAIPTNKFLFWEAKTLTCRSRGFNVLLFIFTRMLRLEWLKMSVFCFGLGQK